MGRTPVLGLPYPEEEDSVDIPRDLKALAEACVRSTAPPGPWIDDTSLVEVKNGALQIEHMFYRTWGPVYNAILIAKFIGDNSGAVHGASKGIIRADKDSNLSGGGGTNQENNWPYLRDIRLAPFWKQWDDASGAWKDPANWTAADDLAKDTFSGMMMAWRPRDSYRMWASARQETDETRIPAFLAPWMSVGQGGSNDDLPGSLSDVSQDLIRMDFVGVALR